mmetsp:Transcript_2078/g.7170  ORF Transcript_2078/g.7170 Transcript_2078/m.7170 type:complete len:204 (-) Transcript_2078:208-819(-)
MVLFRLTERVITLTGCLYRRGRRGIGRRRKCHFFRFRYPRCELRVPPSPEPGHFQIPIVVPPTKRKHASEVACREFPEKRVHEPPPRWDVLLGGFVVARGLFVFVFPRLRRKRCVCHRESLRDRRGCKQTRLTRRDALQHFSRLNQLGVKARHAVAQGHVRLVLVIMTSRAFAAHGAWNARIAPWTDSGRGLLRVRRDRGERG